MMKLRNAILSFGLTTALLAAPLTGSAVVGASDAAKEKLKNELAAEDLINPEFISNAAFDFYPIALDVGGFSSILVVANLQDANAFIQICTVPAGTTEFNCRGGIAFAPRQSRFFTMDNIGLGNTSGQIFIFDDAGGGFLASNLFMFSDNGFTAVTPIQG